MPHDAGVWLDHAGALIVTIDARGGAAARRIPSNVEPRRHSRPHSTRSNTTHRALGAAKHEENRRREHVKAYYSALAAALAPAGRILLLGPSVAKYELAAALRAKKSRAPKVLAVEPSGRLTQRQLIRHVEDFFREHPPTARRRA